MGDDSLYTFITFIFSILNTLPMGVVVKYFYEYVSVFVCLSTRISLEPHMRS